MLLDRCASTNDLAREAGLNGAPHGSWVSARVQEAGRGRLGRHWESLEGNLFLSIVLRVADQGLWSWLPLATAIGTVRALNALFPDSVLKSELKLKWPNDLWIGRAKLAGILCEGHPGRGNGFVVAGLGLNCAESPGQARVGPVPAISLSESLGQAVAADQVREPVLRGILAAVDELMRSGSAGIREAYNSCALFTPGQRVEWGERESGSVLGLGEIGELLVTDSRGALQKLYAEDVRIRF